ncbi:MAG TPA: ABC transporter ATP-binding protein [Gammaproteobacteria bacterium]|nr:ABC transporter ATP-binding protein [Gammaproteobacteria bacterium]
MHALSVQQLEKIYKNGVHALNKIDLTVEEGDFFALLGPNGAGKTTLIGIITSLVTKTSGKIWVFDKDMDTDIELVKSYIGLVPQEFNFMFVDDVTKVIMNQAGFYGLPWALAKQRTEKYLKQLDLWDKRKTPARMLSGGMKRRLMIARALVHEPKLLILDEPTAGVDIEIRRMMWDFLREINRQGTTIILTTHYLEEAENLCRNIAIIDHGNIIENTKMNVLLNRLNTETIVLYLQNSLSINPLLPGFPSRLVDELTLEVDLKQSQTMNELFAVLSQQSIQVSRMRNKSNRLEELFLQLVGTGQEKHDAA